MNEDFRKEDMMNYYVIYRKIQHYDGKQPLRIEKCEDGLGVILFMAKLAKTNSWQDIKVLKETTLEVVEK